MSEEKLVVRRAVITPMLSDHVVAERVGESKVMLGHTYRSGICAQVSSISYVWYSLRLSV